MINGSSEEDIKSLVDHVAALKVEEERSSKQDIRTLADWISSGKSKILVLSGAGVRLFDVRNGCPHRLQFIF